MILARVPLSLRPQVTRLRVASPARYAHGHGEYHVYFP
jgi:cytochrome c oxidase subunit 7c